MPARRSSGIAACLVLLVFVLGSPATASSGRLEIGQWNATRADALVRLDRAATILDAPDLAGSVRTALDVAGESVGAPLPAGVPTAPGLPADLAAPVGDLLGAVERAEALARSALPATTAQLDAAYTRAMQALAYPRELTERDALASESSGVDRSAFHEATLVLAQAIDAALPALTSQRSTNAAAAVDGCDVLDQLPVLCIGGEGPNTYTKDAALLIDLGGNDIHQNSAGGADPGLASDFFGPGNGLFVSVTLDMAGNDRYETTLPTASGARVVHGAGLRGGVGVLVDQAGDDVYSAHSAEPYPKSLGAAAGGSSVIGAGLLADRGGNDSYSLTHVAPGPGGSCSGASVVAGAQGLGSAGEGLGVLLDDGAGNDSYLVSARPSIPVGEGDLNPVAIGFGTAAAAVAVHADGGGSDSMVMKAEADPKPLSDAGKSACSIANGFSLAALGGTALQLSGEGPTVRSTVSEGFGGEDASATGAAYSLTVQGGFAGTVDEGGNDTYVIDSRSVGSSTATATQGCTCSGAVAEARAGQAWAYGLGHSAIADVAMVHDEGGNDRYAFSAHSLADAKAEDHRTDGPPESAATADATGGWAFVEGMGYGLLGAAGFLLDDGGDDTYEASALSEARAEAISASGNEQARAEAGKLQTAVQAYGVAEGYGELRDQAGSDAYRVSADSRATALPVGEVVRGNPLEAFSAQAAVELGAALLADLGPGVDTFTTSPTEPACQGARGSEVWLDCGLGAGLGINRAT